MLVGILMSLLVGAIVGWLAGKVMNTDFPLWMNIVVGIIGGAVGRFVFGLVGLHSSNLLGGMIVSVIGACILIAVVRAVKK